MSTPSTVDSRPAGLPAVLRRLGGARVIPVATIEHGGQAEQVCRALIAGGVSCIEITFRSAAGAEAVRRARAVDGMFVGAGTLLSVEQVAAAVDAGAQFGVAPGLDRSVIAAAGELGLPFFPGVATPSEIGLARSLGLNEVKVFPAATVGGPAFLRAVSAPYPGMRFIPSGGITVDTLPDYLEVPSVIAVGGSWMVDKALLREERLDEITRRAAALGE